MEDPRQIEIERRLAETMVREEVRRDVGAAMTALGLRLAIRDMTPDRYRQTVLRDDASRLALRPSR